MDAKPQRPLRAFTAPANNENIVPYTSIAPPKDKALGNAQKMSTTTFKGPAKRTAFADVSNTAGTMAFQETKGLSKNNQPGKGVALQISNKENPNRGTNEAFLRPAQRLGPQGLKPSSSQFSLSILPPLVHVPVPNGPTEDLQPLSLAKPVATRRATSVYSDALETRSHVLPTLSANLPQKPLLSRQYKSQPHLKAEQPVLRRTQSKNLDRVDEAAAFEDDLTGLIYEDAVEELAQEEEPRPLDSYLHSVEVAAPAEHLEPAANPEPLDDNMKALKPLPPAPASSEYEEYWDDEEDDDLYDEQGYTTAHSYRSHGDNTTMILAPKVTTKVQRELEEARIITENNLSQDDIDEEMWDVSMVAEYGEEIFHYMKDLETRMLPSPHYMDIQTEMQWSMRSVLMDWLVQVHNRFNLLPETLFLTVNYIDRFLSCKVVSLGKLQLVGATAIFVAAKYEEINCPSVQEIVFMVDGVYTIDEILKAERFMLSMLGFELGWPGPMSFLRRVSKADDYDLETRTLAKYFLEVTIMDERFVGSPPSYLAAGAHCLARLMLKKGDWSHAHAHYSGYTWSQVKPLVAMLLECCQSPRKHHGAVYDKYCDRKFKRAAAFVEDEVEKGFALPFYYSLPRLSISGPLEDESALMRYPPPDNSGLLIPTES
ncbi:G2/mitotic-specific cyclin-4 [Pleurostoma richardsiae]|uniref:G2/mitotic-specific cyclin-4 n=1 Tax=Pleurostoma richardsiae TaxID=41990 RepID=A0AA38RDW1_9PEZI|nr:G2/mitotic-specific cyclin-4 [Pleurostoma richardsiae]